MTTLGAIFRRYGPAYRARYGATLSESQLQAMQAIAQCRTEALGGHVYTCPECQTTRYSYHSCRNRAGLAKTPWMREVNARAWKQSWVVDCRPVGSGATALKYLAPYIFRIALSNNRWCRRFRRSDAVSKRYRQHPRRRVAVLHFSIGGS